MRGVYYPAPRDVDIMINVTGLCLNCELISSIDKFISALALYSTTYILSQMNNIKGISDDEISLASPWYNGAFLSA